MIFPIRSLHFSLQLTKLFGFVRQYNYSRVALWTDIFLDFKMGISLKIRSYLSFCLFSVSYQFRNRSTSIQDKIPDLLNTWGASIQVPGRSTRTLGWRDTATSWSRRHYGILWLPYFQRQDCWHIIASREDTEATNGYHLQITLHHIGGRMHSDADEDLNPQQ